MLDIAGSQIAEELPNVLGSQAFACLRPPRSRHFRQTGPHSTGPVPCRPDRAPSTDVARRPSARTWSVGVPGRSRKPSQGDRRADRSAVCTPSAEQCCRSARHLRPRVQPPTAQSSSRCVSFTSLLLLFMRLCAFCGLCCRCCSCLRYAPSVPFAVCCRCCCRCRYSHYEVMRPLRSVPSGPGRRRR